jgi:hypothetical protein
MSLSVHWWESSSVLTQINTAAVVLAVFVAIWAARYASRPRRGLVYSADMRDPAGDEQTAWASNVVPKDEQQRAVIVTFVLHGSGRLDVPTSLFDNATPITLSVKDAEIRSAAPVKTRRGGGLTPPMQVRDNKLEIGPGLIGRNQVLTYTLLAVVTKQLRQPRLVRVTLTSALVDTRLRTNKADFLIQLGTFEILAVAFLIVSEAWPRQFSFHFPTQPLELFLAILASLIVLFPNKRVTASQQVRMIKASVRKELEDIRRWPILRYRPPQEDRRLSEERPPPEERPLPEERSTLEKHQRTAGQ